MYTYKYVYVEMKYKFYKYVPIERQFFISDHLISLNYKSFMLHPT